jgi:hypothetical protein
MANEVSIILDLDTEASYFKPVPATSVNITADIAAIKKPAIGQQVYDCSTDTIYQFTHKWLTQVTGPFSGTRTEVSVLATELSATDGTVGRWKPRLNHQPSDAWQQSSTNNGGLSTTYRRRLYGEVPRRIEFEANEPTTNNLIVKHTVVIENYDDVIAGRATVSSQFSVQAQSLFYGGPALFIRPVVDNVTSNIAVCVYPDNTVLINNVTPLGTVSGSIRRVKINGLPADPVTMQSLIPTPKPHSTVEHLTGEIWTNGKPIYRRTFTGTTLANDNADIILFTVTGSTEIIRRWGSLSNGTNRTVDMFSVYSGNAGHGPMIQFYGAEECHRYSELQDSRWWSKSYSATIEYTK